MNRGIKERPVQLRPVTDEDDVIHDSCPRTPVSPRKIKVSVRTNTPGSRCGETQATPLSPGAVGDVGKRIRLRDAAGEKPGRPAVYTASPRKTTSTTNISQEEEPTAPKTSTTKPRPAVKSLSRNSKSHNDVAAHSPPQHTSARPSLGNFLSKSFRNPKDKKEGGKSGSKSVCGDPRSSPRKSSGSKSVCGDAVAAPTTSSLRKSKFGGSSDGIRVSADAPEENNVPTSSCPRKNKIGGDGIQVSADAPEENPVSSSSPRKNKIRGDGIRVRAEAPEETQNNRFNHNHTEKEESYRTPSTPQPASSRPSLGNFLNKSFRNPKGSKSVCGDKSSSPRKSSSGGSKSVCGDRDGHSSSSHRKSSGSSKSVCGGTERDGIRVRAEAPERTENSPFHNCHNDRNLKNNHHNHEKEDKPANPILTAVGDVGKRIRTWKDNHSNNHNNRNAKSSTTTKENTDGEPYRRHGDDNQREYGDEPATAPKAKRQPAERPTSKYNVVESNERPTSTYGDDASHARLQPVGTWNANKPTINNNSTPGSTNNTNSRSRPISKGESIRVRAGGDDDDEVPETSAKPSKWAAPRGQQHGWAKKQQPVGTTKPTSNGSPTSAPLRKINNSSAKTAASENSRVRSQSVGDGIRVHKGYDGDGIRVTN